MNSDRGRPPVTAGIDGSDAAKQAATWAAAVAERLGTDLQLVHALPGPRNYFSDAALRARAEYSQRLAEWGRELLDDTAAELRRQRPHLEVVTTVHPGPADLALLEHGDRSRMLVLGATGSGALGSLLAGSTALRVAHRSTCPVVLWRGDPAPEPGTDRRPVLVGIDGSADAGPLVTAAFDMAAALGVGVLAAHAWGAGDVADRTAALELIDWAVVEAEETALLSECLAGQRERYPDVPVTEIVEQIGARHLLLRLAKRAQLSVVGSHGRGLLGGLLLGSTSQALLHHAPCPTMICRPGV
ncbi:universal stress protein [Rhodococcus ruber]|uniref:universal stress protein n=1 Tax=Rhodococcus ruber TaxID=1830 RepID=UPI0007CD5A15|nr:universal stress protein [Rhodococcus ruber]AWG97925.1 universal stress protein [Rhodococcus ruber]